MGRATVGLVVALAASYAVWLARKSFPTPGRVLPVYRAAVLIQCAHLVEEYRTDFHYAFPAVFGTAPWSDRRFLVFNFIWLAIFVAGGIGLAREHRLGYLAALFLAVGGGILNGFGHLTLSALQRGYFPGTYTAVLAFLVGSVLAVVVLRKADVTARA